MLIEKKNNIREKKSRIEILNVRSVKKMYFECKRSNEKDEKDIIVMKKSNKEVKLTLMKKNCKKKIECLI